MSWSTTISGSLNCLLGSFIDCKDEVDYVKEHRDPLKIFREKVKDQIDLAKLDAIDAESKANVDDAVAKARAAKYPEVSQLLTDVYVSY